jgi:hypothetical protein
MALSIVERKVLEAARLSIKNQKERYICYAIDRANPPYYDMEKLKEAKRRLMAYVMSSLEGSATLAVWAAERNGKRWLSFDLQREARIAWITWMLDEQVVVDVKTRREFTIYLNPLRAIRAYDGSGDRVK